MPTYDVFDEMRNFAPADSQQLFTLAGNQVALTICEDAWNDKNFWDRRLYGVDPVEDLMRAGGKVLLNISASPVLSAASASCAVTCWPRLRASTSVPVALVNQVGGNDSLVFDGSSLVLGPDGSVIAQAKSFEEDLIFFDADSLTGDMHERDESEEGSAYAALVLGTRDYVRKCGFKQRRARPQRRHRFGAHRLHRGRRSGCGERHGRRHAGSVFVARQH